MAIDINEFNGQFQERMDKLIKFANYSDEIKGIMGIEAEKHFKESFQNQGFTDQNLEPWADVKRRDPNSPWYGKGTRATAKILVDSNSLYNAIHHEATEKGTRVFNMMPYGRVHNFGGMAKIYGKKAFQMLARPFIGPSREAVRKINAEIQARINDIKAGK
jgi:phage gpG-like protein